MPEFKLNPAYTPTADQPKAIDALAEGLEASERFQTLLGATGTGKTFTMAGAIERLQRPALVIAHNKTLAAQLCNEFREFFPENAVEYFVSYYDYYQPEAYVPAQDLYIEKDSSINDEIDRLRHAATASLFARRDVIIVASVSCIYGIGSPELYKRADAAVQGRRVDRPRRALPEAGRNAVPAQRHQPRPRHVPRQGEMLEIYPAYAESAYRIRLFGDEIEGIQHFDPLTGEVLDEIDHVSVWPASHYVVKEETMERAVERDRAPSSTSGSPLRGAGQAARGPPPEASAPATTWRCCSELGFSPGDRELLADLRRPPAGKPALHADRLLPRRLRRLHRRVPPDDSADRGHVRGRFLAEVDSGRLRLPAALGDRQPPAQVRRVPRPGRSAGAGLGDPGSVRARRVRPDRRADRPPDRDRRPRGRGPRDEEPDRRPDERGPARGPSATRGCWSPP